MAYGPGVMSFSCRIFLVLEKSLTAVTYEGWNFNSGNYLFTTDTK